ncbi:MFS transporter [Peribacillus kribbensis]|uniref:MFS transporter n=1 Tax=Peribacillus kribbensis TaxID=356658 RepID=UPI0004052920|nr:MFS transporter [Peribacillus kribbensis]
MSAQVELVQNEVKSGSHRSAYLTLAGSWLGWLFDALDAGVFGFVLLAIATTFKVEISSVVSTVAWFLLATGIGGYVLGNISDRIGRKKTLVLSVFAYALGTLLCGFADSVAALNIYRFLVGFAVGGLWSAAAALISEVWKPEGRAKALSFMQTGWSGGNLLAAIFAWNILNPADPESWRNLFFIASIPAFATLLFIVFFVKESPVWLANREFMKQNTKKAGLGVIFHKKHLKVTALALSVSILGMLGYWIIFTFVPTYLQQILGIRIDQAPVFLVWTGVGAMAGYIVYGYIAEVIGRRLSFMIFFLGMTAIIPAFTYVSSHMPLTHGVLALSGGNVVKLGVMSALLGFFTGYFSGFGAWYSELFPTSIRSTAAGFCFNFGRVGAIAGIKLVPVLLAAGMSFPVVITMAAISYFVAAFLVLAIRETKGTELTSGN